MDRVIKTVYFRVSNEPRKFYRRENLALIRDTHQSESLVHCEWSNNSRGPSCFPTATPNLLLLALVVVVLDYVIYF